MAEVVGLASGLLALTIFAYDTSKSLYEAVSSFKSQRKTIKDVEDDLRSLVIVLGLIREQGSMRTRSGDTRASSTAIELLRNNMWRNARNARCVYDTFEGGSGQCPGLAKNAVPWEEFRRREATTR